MEEKVVIRHVVPGDEAMLAEIQAESWEAAFSGILPDEKLKSHLDKQRIAQMYHYVLNETSAHGSLLLIDSSRTAWLSGILTVEKTTRTGRS